MGLLLEDQAQDPRRRVQVMAFTRKPSGSIPKAKTRMNSDIRLARMAIDLGSILVGQAPCRDTR